MWGGGAPPWEPTAHDDGDPSIRTAVAFYATTTTWYWTGAELRAPASSGLGIVTLSLYVTTTGVLPDLSAVPAASAQVEVGAGGGSYEARWGDPVEITAPNFAWICLETAAGDQYLFVSGSTVGPGFVQAAGGIDLYMAEAGDPRSAFRVPPGATSSSSAWYGVGPIVSDTPAPPTPSGGSVAGISVSAVGAGRARHSGSSATAVAVSASGAGVKRARGGAATTVSATATGAGYNPANVPDALPTQGTLVPLTPARAMVPLTPRRGLEIV